MANWSPDGRLLFLSLNRSPADDDVAPASSGMTLVIPLARGLAGAPIPVNGFPQDSGQEFPGLQVIRQAQLSPGPNANTYARTVTEFQGNLFRIPLH